MIVIESEAKLSLIILCLLVLMSFTRSGVSLHKMNLDRRECGAVCANCFHCLVPVISVRCNAGGREEVTVLCRIKGKGKNLIFISDLTGKCYAAS